MVKETATTLMLLLMACGMEEYPEDVLEQEVVKEEPVCWTEDGLPNLFWHVPKGTEVSEAVEEQCARLWAELSYD